MKFVSTREKKIKVGNDEFIVHVKIFVSGVNTVENEFVSVYTSIVHVNQHADTCQSLTVNLFLKRKLEGHSSYKKSYRTVASKPGEPLVERGLSRFITKAEFSQFLEDRETDAMMIGITVQ